MVYGLGQCCHRRGALSVVTGLAVVLACVITACGGSGSSDLAPVAPPTDDTTIPPVTLTQASRTLVWEGHGQ